MQDACVHHAAGISLPRVTVTWPAASPGRDPGGRNRAKPRVEPQSTCATPWTLGVTDWKPPIPRQEPPGLAAGDGTGRYLALLGLSSRLSGTQRGSGAQRQDSGRRVSWGDLTHSPDSASSQLGSRCLRGFGSPVPEDCKAPQGAAGFRNCYLKLSPNLQRARKLWAFSLRVSANPALQV